MFMCWWPCCGGDPIGVYLFGGSVPSGPFPQFATGRTLAYTTADTWATRTSFATPRARMTGTVHSGEGYLFGGVDNSSTIVATTEKYNPGTDSWTGLTSATTATYTGCATSDGTDSYVVEGQNTSGPASPNLHQQYDVSGDSWSTKAALSMVASKDVSYPNSFGISGKPYVVGGYYFSGSTTAATTNKTMEYDPSGDSWSTKATFTDSRSQHMAETDGTYGYLWCGDNSSDESGGAFTDLQRYDAGSDSWTTRASIGVVAVGGSSAYEDGLIYSIGGSGGSGFASTNTYDNSTNTWSSAGALPEGCHFGVGAGGL